MNQKIEALHNVMPEKNNDTDESELESRLRLGDQSALGELFDRHRERLKRIASFRLDYRLVGRVSNSDVIQEAFIASAKRLDHFREQKDLPAFLWLRMITSQQVTELYRKHLGAEKRDARREVALTRPNPSPHTSMAIAAHLVQQMTAVSEVVSRAEQIEKLEQVLNTMDDIDREVIALRHFEELTNVETANVLGIEKSAASKRYLRAMTRLAELMKDFQQ